MGRLILAAQMDRTGADFAVMSGGGIRDSIEAGDISYKNVLKVQPFGNVVVYADMTGKEVIDYLTAVAQMKPDSGAYPQFANVSFVAKDGKLNDLKINGEPVDPAKTYRLRQCLMPWRTIALYSSPVIGEVSGPAVWKL